MRRTTPALLAVVLAAVPPAARAAAQAGPAAGCYDLHVPSSHELVESADSVFLGLPPRVELDTVPGMSSTGPRGFALRAAPGALPSIHDHAWWEWADPRTVSLVWLTSSGGVGMQLVPDQDGLRGRMTALWSFPRNGPEAEVEAVRVACDDPLPEAQRAVYRLARGVELAEGDSLRIGELPPDGGEPLPLSEGLYRFTGVAGLFEEASEARVATDSAGVVRSIRLLYPEGVDYGELAGRFGRAFGGPSSSSHPPDPRGSAEWSAWQDRMVGVTIWNSVAADGLSQIVVVLRDPRF